MMSRLLSQLVQLVTLRGHSFIPALDSSAVVVDLGAHRAEFSNQIVERFGCRCVAIEANPDLVKKIRPARNIELVWGAVSDQDGTAEFYLSDSPEASTLFAHGVEINRKRVVVPMFTLEKVFKEHGISHISVLKIDIEGAEIPTLLSTPDNVMRSIDQITVEFHDFCDLISAKQIAAVRARLAILNFEEINLATGHEKFSNMNCLFVRRDAQGIDPLRRVYLKFGVTHGRRVVHFMRRVKNERELRRADARTIEASRSTARCASADAGGTSAETQRE